MKKFRVKTSEQTLGPFYKYQIKDLVRKGRISDFDIQEFPSGDWFAFEKHPDFIKDTTSTDATFVRRLDSIKREIEEEKKEKESFLDDELREQHKELRVGKDVEITLDEEAREEVKEEIEVEKADEVEKTVIKKVLHGETADKTVLRKLSPAEEQEVFRLKEEKLKQASPIVEVKEERVEKVLEDPTVSLDYATEMINLNDYKNEIISEVKSSEKELKEAKLLSEQEEHESVQLLENNTAQDEPNKEPEKKKKGLIYQVVVAVIIILAVHEIYNESQSSNKKAFNPVVAKILYPVPNKIKNKEESKRAEANGDQLFSQANYPSRLEASRLYYKSLINDVDNNTALGKLIYISSYLVKDDLNKFNAYFNLQRLIELGEARIPLDINYTTGAANFYNQLEKPKSAILLIERFLRVKKKSTPNMLAVYLTALVLDGREGDAKKVYGQLSGLPNKGVNVIMSLLNFLKYKSQQSQIVAFLKSNSEKYSKSVPILMEYASILLQQRKFQELAQLLDAVELLQAEQSPSYYADFLKFKGALLIVSGDKAEAGKKFKLSLKIKESDETRRILASLSESNSDTLNALVAESKIEAIVDLSRRSLKKRDFNKALVYAVEANDFDKSNYVAAQQLAIVQRERGHFKSAMNILKSFQKDFPNHIDSKFDLVRTYIDAYMFDTAFSVLNQVNKALPNDPFLIARSKFLIGYLYYKQRNTLSAINWLRQAGQADPLNDYVSYLLANLFLKISKLKEAKTFINKAIQLNPGLVEYRALYSNIVYQSEGAEVAIGYVRSILGDYDSDPILLGEIAKYYYNSGQQKQFEDQLKLMKASEKRSLSLFKGLYETALVQGDFESMINFGREISELSPGDLLYKVNLSEKLVEFKKYDEAIKILTEVVDRLNTFPRVMLLLSKIYYNKGDLDKSIEFAEKEVKNNPRIVDTYNLLGNIHLKKEELKTARSFFTKAQQKDPENFEALYGLGFVNFNEGRYDIASQLLFKAAKVRPNDPLARRQLGYVYMKLGQRTLAQEAFKVYLELSPDADDKDRVNGLLNSLK